MKKILYIVLLIVPSAYSQGFDSLLIASQAQFANEVVTPTNIYVELSAANPQNDTDAIGSWDSENNTSTITSVSNGDGTFSIRGTAITTGTIRINCYFPVVSGEQYTLTFKALESSGSDGRLVDFTLCSISSSVVLNGAMNSYTRTLTATGTGTARLGFFIYSGTVGKYLDIDDLSVIKI